MSLPEILCRKIRENGPVSVAEFMGLALSHPEHGYYMTRDPFGRGGDFITAPEVSQMFGEMIGVWAADVWAQMGRPERFVLLECGPGRGTLMADMMRACKGVPGFHGAARVALMEISPVLKAKQAEALTAYAPLWVAGLKELPPGVPVIAVGNEFLDALPVHQYERTAQGWAERMVDVDSNGKLFYIMQNLLGDASSGAAIGGPQGMENIEVGNIVEVSPAREVFVKELYSMLQERGGAGLLIDYGSERSGTGDTLQAVYKHAPCGVFEHIGRADLTSHVDFGAFDVPGHFATQGKFLRAMGIELRAAVLEKAGAEGISADLHRLVSDDEMGQLFKVMGLKGNESITLAGF